MLEGLVGPIHRIETRVLAATRQVSSSVECFPSVGVGPMFLVLQTLGKTLRLESQDLLVDRMTGLESYG